LGILIIPIKNVLKAQSLTKLQIIYAKKKMQNGILGSSKRIQKKPKSKEYVKFTEEEENKLILLLKKLKASFKMDQSLEGAKDSSKISPKMIKVFIKRHIPLFVILSNLCSHFS